MQTEMSALSNIILIVCFSRKNPGHKTGTFMGVKRVYAWNCPPAGGRFRIIFLEINVNCLGLMPCEPPGNQRTMAFLELPVGDPHEN